MWYLYGGLRGAPVKKSDTLATFEDGYLHRWASNEEPTVNDDRDQGFDFGSLWVQFSPDGTSRVFLCKSAESGAAEWVEWQPYGQGWESEIEPWTVSPQHNDPEWDWPLALACSVAIVALVVVVKALFAP